MSWKDGSVFAIVDLKLVSSTHNGQHTTDCNCSLRGSDALFWPLLTCTYTRSHAYTRRQCTLTQSCTHTHAGARTLTNNYKYHTHTITTDIFTANGGHHKKNTAGHNAEINKSWGTQASRHICRILHPSPKRGLEGCKSQNTRMSSVRLTLIEMTAWTRPEQRKCQ